MSAKYLRVVDGIFSKILTLYSISEYQATHNHIVLFIHIIFNTVIDIQYNIYSNDNIKTAGKIVKV